MTSFKCWTNKILSCHLHLLKLPSPTSKSCHQQFRHQPVDSGLVDLWNLSFLVGVFDDESISEDSTEGDIKDETEVVVAVYSRFETKEDELEFESGEIFEGRFQIFPRSNVSGLRTLRTWSSSYSGSNRVRAP